MLKTGITLVKDQEVLKGESESLSVVAFICTLKDPGLAGDLRVEWKGQDVHHSPNLLSVGAEILTKLFQGISRLGNRESYFLLAGMEVAAGL